MKNYRAGLAIIFTLLSVAAADAQTQRSSSRPTSVAIRPDGLAIRLNQQSLRSGRSVSGSRAIAQGTIRAIENHNKACYNVDRNRLGRQIQAHAWANLVPLRSVQRRANPVNVTWPELRRSVPRSVLRR